MEPLITILIVAKNEALRLPKLLRMLEKQSYTNIEVVLVDNGSTDETPHIMEVYSKKSRYTVKVLSEKGTLAQAYNRGLREARGDYIAIIGGDEIPTENWVRDLYSCIAGRGCDACLAPVVYMPRCYATKCIRSIAEWYFRRSVLEILFNKREASKRIVFNTGNTIFRASVIRKISFYDPLPLAEDGEMSYRFIKWGFKLCYTPLAIAFHPSPQNHRQHLSFWWKLAYANKVLLDIHSYTDLWKVVFRNIFLAHLDPREWVKSARYNSYRLLRTMLLHIEAFLAFTYTFIYLNISKRRILYGYVQREK